MNLRQIASSPNRPEFFQKETEPSLIFADQSYFTCLLWGLFLEYAGFYAGPTNDALEEAENEEYESYGPARHYYIWVVSRPASFLLENFDTER